MMCTVRHMTCVGYPAEKICKTYSMLFVILLSGNKVISFFSHHFTLVDSFRNPPQTWLVQDCATGSTASREGIKRRVSAGGFDITFGPWVGVAFKGRIIPIWSYMHMPAYVNMNKFTDLWILPIQIYSVHQDPRQSTRWVLLWGTSVLCHFVPLGAGCCVEDLAGGFDLLLLPVMCCTTVAELSSLSCC